MNLLQIEDNPGDARLIREMLRDRPDDFVITVCERLSDGLDFIDSHRVDIVLLDLHLPDSSGLASLSALKQRHPRVPTVVMTSIDDEELGIQAVRQGAEDYLVKGQTSGRLLKRILLHTVERTRMEEGRRELTKQIDEERRRLRAVLDALPVGVGIADSSGRKIEMNETVNRIWNGAASRVQDISDYSQYKGWFTHNSKQVKPEEWTLLRAIRTGVPVLGEIIDIERFDGSFGTIVESAAPITNEQGEIVGGVGITQDITTLRQMEEALRQREQEYRQLMEEAADGIILVDEKGLVVTVNLRACELLGYERGELTGTKSSDLLDMDGRALLRSASREGVPGKSAVIEHTLRRKDGTRVHVETSVRKLADGRYQGIVRDITERRKSAEEFTFAVKNQVFDKLLDALREIRHGEGLAMNLHRLALFAKNLELLYEEPVEVNAEPISGDTQKSDSSQEPSARERLHVAIEEYKAVGYQKLRTIASLLRAVESELESKRMSNEEPISSKDIANLADQLLADMDNLMERVKGGAPDLKAKDFIDLGGRLAEHIDLLQRKTLSVSRRLNAHFTCNLSTVVATIAQVFRVRSRDIAVAVYDQTPDTHVLISPEDLGEVLSLLMNNAVDALNDPGSVKADEQKTITLRLLTSETDIRIEVENNGPSVPQEVSEKIMTDGFSTKGSGHGHGLTFAQKHLSKYGALLWYDGAFYGGARFCIELMRA